ncbi:MAG: MBL fold metallo-hydrolase [Bacteroidota bacterium]|jgi:hydroxyacylglutathione hydrolase
MPLNLHTFTFNAFSENTYLVWDENKIGVAIDPGMMTREEEHSFRSFLTENEIQLQRVWLTHCHIDHIMGLDYIHRNYGIVAEAHALDQVNVERSPLVAEMYGLPYSEGPAPQYVLEPGNLSHAGIACVVRFTPGHSPGHVVFYFEKEGWLLAGDTLFQGSIGRTDLPGGDFATLEKSIRNELYTLPNETRVYSGHGPATTIEFEKNANPFVRP